MGVSKNRGKTPKWMVKTMETENPIKIDDLGAPFFLETPILSNDSFVVRFSLPMYNSHRSGCSRGATCIIGGPQFPAWLVKGI